MEILNLLIIILMVLFKNVVCNDSFLAKFQQHEYKIRNVRVEIKSYDEDYINFVTSTTFKSNRTTVAINATLNLKITVGDKLEVVVQGYKFLSNEYRIFHGFLFQVHLCKAVNSNMVGLRSIFNCGNFRECFFVKDITYHFCNLVIDEARFPPLIPNGEYKTKTEIMYLNHVICTLNFYVEIYRPIYPK